MDLPHDDADFEATFKSLNKCLALVKELNKWPREYAEMDVKQGSAMEDLIGLCEDYAVQAQEVIEKGGDRR